MSRRHFERRPTLAARTAIAAIFLAVSAPAGAALGANADEAIIDSPAGAPTPIQSEAEARKISKKEKKRSREKDESDTIARAVSESADQAVANPPMWRMSDDDTEIYLVGTFHVLPPGLRWRSSELGHALDQSDEVWFEAEVDTPAAQEETRRILLNKGFLRPGKSLTEELSTDGAAKLQEVSERLALPIAAVDRMRPWQAFLALSVQFIVSRGFDPASGLEPGLLKEARARGRRLVFLESVDEQLGFFTELTPAVETALLELTLSEWDNQAEDFQLLYDAWRRGDTPEIDALMNAAMREKTPEIYKILLKDRNAAWADRLEAAMSEPGKKLVAVGAAHLAGPDSLPDLLAAKGLQINRYGLNEANSTESLTDSALSGDDSDAGAAANSSGGEAENGGDKNKAESDSQSGYEPPSEGDQIERLLESVSTEAAND